MRSVCALAGLMLLTLACLAAGEETRPLRLEAAETKVYSSNGTGSLITGVLRHGATVKVVRELPGGWLEIEPPEGSFSWINNLFVDRVGNSLGIVSEAPVKLRVGSMVTPNQPTNVETAPVPKGAQFFPLASRPVAAEGSTWWKVEPSQRERRYIQLPAAGGKATPVKPVIVNPAAQGVPVSRPQPPAAADTDSLWKQAQEADHAGNAAEAERLYSELARVSHDESLRILALNRAQFLRDSQRGPRTPRVSPEPTRPAVPPAPPFQPTAMPGKPVTPSYPTGTAPPVGMGAAPANANTRSGPGRLEPAAFRVDGRRTYALVSSQGLPRLYATAQDGVDLERYVNRNVELVGPTVYHGQLRTNYMRVAQVVALQ